MTQLYGYYCPGSFSPKGAYVWLTVINFCSLSLILAALFTYLAVYNNEWKLGSIKAHGMFWCVKGPIMIIFYFGNILLAALVAFHVIKDIPAANGGTDWPAAAIKNGYYSIVVCFVMCVDSMLMMKFYGMDDEDYFDHKGEHLNFFFAINDAFLAFIPQFIRNLMSCGSSTVRLAKKRQEMKMRRKLAGDESTMALNRDFNHRESHADYDNDPMADIDLEDLPRMPATHHEAKMFEEEGKSNTRIRELGAINPYSPPQQPLTATAYPSAPHLVAPFQSPAPEQFAEQQTPYIPPPPAPPLQQQIQRTQPAFEFEEAYTPQTHQDVLSMPPRTQFPRDRSPVPTSNASVFNPYEMQTQHATEQKVFNPYAPDKKPSSAPDGNPFK